MVPGKQCFNADANLELQWRTTKPRQNCIWQHFEIPNFIF